MAQLVDLFAGLDVKPTTIVDIGLTALLIYGLFSLIRDTRAVRLVIGVTVVYAVYVVAQMLGLQLLSQVLQAGAVVGLFALVVVFQPELRRALERLGRLGPLGWILTPAGPGTIERVAAVLAEAAASLASVKHGALIVIERETGLEDLAETGVMLHADLSVELLETIFMPPTALHDGAVIVRGDRVLAAAALLPLSETSSARSERLGTRHRAALGITEETDALVVVVSEESGMISLVEHGRIVRRLDEDKLRVALVTLMRLGMAHTPAPLVAGASSTRQRITRPALEWMRGRQRESRRRPPNRTSPSAGPPAQSQSFGTPVVDAAGAAGVSGAAAGARTAGTAGPDGAPAAGASSAAGTAGPAGPSSVSGAANGSGAASPAGATGASGVAGAASGTRPGKRT